MLAKGLMSSDMPHNDLLRLSWLLEDRQGHSRSGETHLITKKNSS